MATVAALLGCSTSLDGRRAEPAGLARDYEYYLRWRDTSQEALSVEPKVSSNRLSAFKTGKGWSSGPLVAILRARVPSLDYMRDNGYQG